MTNLPHSECSHYYQEWKGDVPHKQYDLPLQQGVMEYDHPGEGTIVHGHQQHKSVTGNLQTYL